MGHQVHAFLSHFLSKLSHLPIQTISQLSDTAHRCQRLAGDGCVIVGIAISTVWRTLKAMFFNSALYILQRILCCNRQQKNHIDILLDKGIETLYIKYLKNTWTTWDKHTEYYIHHITVYNTEFPIYTIGQVHKVARGQINRNPEDIIGQMNTNSKIITNSQGWWHQFGYFNYVLTLENPNTLTKLFLINLFFFISLLSPL